MDGRLGLRPKEVARQLGLSERTVQELIRTNQLPHVRLKRAVIVPVAALEAWLARRTRANAVGQGGEGNDQDQATI